MLPKKFTDFIFNLFFPKFCFNCCREGSYLCQDCRSILEINNFHQKFSDQNIKDLYFALDYQNPLIKNLIRKFKYEPFIKELAETFSFLIIEHFQLLDNPPSFLAKKDDFILMPIPLEKKRMKWRGFNQAEEISINLSFFLEIPLISGCLVKVKENFPQTELAGKTRKENVKGVFRVKKKCMIENKKILLVDDVYTSGSTMKEAAKTLKEAGAEEIIGIVVARAKPGDDFF